jgi:hypothetical protein
MTMETTWIEIGGLTIRAPVTAGTNLALAVQCALYFHSLRLRSVGFPSLGFSSLRAGGEARARLWGGFFLMMAFATFAGMFKHAFQHEMSETARGLLLWISNVGGGVSTYFAQRASLVFHAPVHVERRLEWLLRVQLILFLGSNIVLGPLLILLIVNSAVGLLPVIGVEAKAAHLGHPGSSWIAGGLSVSILTAGVYIVGLSIGPWLNHIDIAHFMMGASFWMMMRGCPMRLGIRRPYAVPRAATSASGAF